MTYRHHYAERISEDATGCIYRFTPDSIRMQDWGLVKMNEVGCEIIELAPDTSSCGWSRENQESCCAALYAKFLRIRRAEGQTPVKIEFVA
jgi:hypothetical protein